MPWDGTELRVLRLDTGEVDVLLGGTEESVLQPEWIDDETLRVISDRSGWWNLYRVNLFGEVAPVRPIDADFGAPLWQLGAVWHVELDAGTVLTTRTVGTDTLALLDPATGALRDIELEDISSVQICDTDGRRILLRCGGARVASGLRLLDLGVGTLTDVRLSVDDLPDVEYLPEAQHSPSRAPNARSMRSSTPRATRNFVAPEGELPPYVAFVHGGPTAHVAPAVHLVYVPTSPAGASASSTSTTAGPAASGASTVIGCADSGASSTSRTPSRRPRPRRRGPGRPRPSRDRGWLGRRVDGVLSALTTSDVFACGVSYYGVAELMEFVKETHDFESRYIDGLIGPLPDAADLYVRRAPSTTSTVCRVRYCCCRACPTRSSRRRRPSDSVPPCWTRKIPHAYLAYEGEAHGFRRVETIVSAREAELSFYGQVMGFETPGVPRLELWRP